MDVLLSHPAMLVYGLLLHLVKKLGEASLDGTPVNPWVFLKGQPYRTLSSLLGALVGYAMLVQSGELTLLTAFGAGYMANSVAEFAAKSAERRLERAK